MNNKVFISCAVTGSGDTAKKHPDLPKTPEQIAKASIEAAKAGAAAPAPAARHGPHEGGEAARRGREHEERARDGHRERARERLAEQQRAVVMLRRREKAIEARLVTSE